MNFPDWASRSAEALVIGKIEPLAEGRVEVRFRLFDVAKQSQLASYSYVIAPAQLRSPSEQIALDEVIGRLARAKLLAAWRAARGQVGVGQFVLVGAVSRREIGNYQHQQDKPAD